jgi:hypothetical protein
MKHRAKKAKPPTEPNIATDAEAKKAAQAHGDTGI